MSGVIVIMPIVAAAAWPAVVTAASTVMLAMGFAAINNEMQVQQELGVITELNKVELKLSNSEEVGQSVGRDQSLEFERDGLKVKFTRDVRGRLTVCVEGDLPKAELEELGYEYAGKVIQQFAYDRIIASMGQKSGVSLVEQSVDEDETIRIKLRSYEE